MTTYKPGSDLTVIPLPISKLIETYQVKYQYTLQEAEAAILTAENSIYDWYVNHPEEFTEAYLNGFDIQGALYAAKPIASDLCDIADYYWVYDTDMVCLDIKEMGFFTEDHLYLMNKNEWFELGLHQGNATIHYIMQAPQVQIPHAKM